MPFFLLDFLVADKGVSGGHADTKHLYLMHFFASGPGTRANWGLCHVLIDNFTREPC